MDVITNPISTPSTGFVKLDRKVMTAGISLRAAMELDMVDIPTNRSPNPITISPDFFTVGLGIKFIITAPKKTNIGAIADNLKATSIAVTVVPILAPSMIPQALESAIKPELTKVTTITVAVLEDCITAVKNSPTSTPVSLVLVNVSSIFRSLLPATFSIP